MKRIVCTLASVRLNHAGLAGPATGQIYHPDSETGEVEVADLDADELLQFSAYVDPEAASTAPAGRPAPPSPPKPPPAPPAPPTSIAGGSGAAPTEGPAVPPADDDAGPPALAEREEREAELSKLSKTQLGEILKGYGIAGYGKFDADYRVQAILAVEYSTEE